MQFGHMTNATTPTTADTADPSTTSMRRITTDMAPPDAAPPQVPPRSIMTTCGCDDGSHHDMEFTSVVSHSVITTATTTATVTTNDPLRHTHTRIMWYYR